MADRRARDLGANVGRASGPAGGTRISADSNRSAGAVDRRSASLQQIQTTLWSGRVGEALRLAQAHITRYRKDAEAHVLLALAAEQARDLKTAREYASRANAMSESPNALMLLSRLARLVGQTGESLRLSDRALVLRPGDVQILVHRAGTLEEAGRFGEARAVVDPLIEQFESRGQSLPAPLRFELAKLLVQEKNYDRAVEVIDSLVQTDSSPNELARLAYYLRAKAHDRAGRYDEAFASATLGNEIGRIEFDPRLYEQQVSTLIETWSAERMARFPQAACDDELPVFVAGMPRSGTSLIDQIIDAHPKAAGVGELASIERFAAKLSAAYDPEQEPPACFGNMNQFKWTRVAQDYLREVRRQAPPGTERIVNKALGNNKLVGLLARLFPRTRVIHAMRDPRDVAISCYMGGFNNRLHAWTTRIDWVASAWAQSLRMMEHWKATLDIPILDVQYEALVCDPGTQFPRLIAFLGLDWDEACNEFHKSRRTVRTLSYDQVNRPVYTTSAGRHANYQAHIKDVVFPVYPPK